MAKKRKSQASQPSAEDEQAPIEQPVDAVVEEDADEEEENEEEAKVDANGVEEDYEEEPIDRLLEPFSKEQLVLLLKDAVSKHPDFVSSIHKMADMDPAHRKIFVHGLGWDSNAEILTSEFGKYGEIEDCKVVADKVSGKSKGYAFILFKRRSGAQKALKEPQKKIGNRMTSCQLASAGPIPAPPPTAPPVSEYTQRKIFVSNVSAEIDPQKLLEYFSTFGEIEDGPLGLDKQTGKPRGFALFVYKSIESAKKALQEPHKTFEGHTLNVQKAVDGPKPHKQMQQQPYFNQQYGGGQSKKAKYNSGGQGHLMAPSGPPMGYNPGPGAGALTPALGQALTALLASQGAALLGGLGQQGMPPAGYGGQQGYPPNPQMGQGGASSYMGGHTQ